MREVSVCVLALSILLAGCTSIGDDSRTELEGAAPLAPAASTVVAREHAAPTVESPVGSLDVSTQVPWLKPRNIVEMNVEWPAGQTGRWLVSAHGARATATTIGAVHYLRGGTSLDTLGATPPADAPLIDTGNLPPGVLSRAVELTQPGAVELSTPRHPSVQFRVDVHDGLDAEAVDVSLVNDAYGFRFVPPALAVGVGSSVRFYNEDVASHAVIAHRVWSQLATQDASISVVGVDPGWYELAAQSAPGTGARSSEGRAFILIDFDAPTSRGVFGPYTASNTIVPPDGPRNYPMQAPLAIAKLDMVIRLRGERLVGDMRVEVVLDDEVLAARTINRSETFTFSDLPAGNHTIRVHNGDGPTHGFEVQGDARYAIILPQIPSWLLAGAK